MTMSLLVLVFSVTLFLFYLQALCERVLRREFSQPYYEDVIRAIQLEYPGLMEGAGPASAMEYPNARLALACDFATLEFLLKKADRSGRPLSGRERLLFLYFRFLLFCLPFRHALRLGERKAVWKLAAILQFFTNLVGERMPVSPLGNALSDPQA